MYEFREFFTSEINSWDSTDSWRRNCENIRCFWKMKMHKYFNWNYCHELTLYFSSYLWTTGHMHCCKRNHFNYTAGLLSYLQYLYIHVCNCVWIKVKLSCITFFGNEFTYFIWWVVFYIWMIWRQLLEILFVMNIDDGETPCHSLLQITWVVSIIKNSPLHLLLTPFPEKVLEFPVLDVKFVFV